jgi:hypothetical protein
MTGTAQAQTSDQSLDAGPDHSRVLRCTGADRRRGRIRAWTGSAFRDVVYCGAVLAWSKWECGT